MQRSCRLSEGGDQDAGIKRPAQSWEIIVPALWSRSQMAGSRSSEARVNLRSAGRGLATAVTRYRIVGRGRQGDQARPGSFLPGDKRSDAPIRGLESPKGARFDSPGRSAAQAWDPLVPPDPEPQRGETKFTAPDRSRVVIPFANRVSACQACRSSGRHPTQGCGGPPPWAIESRPFRPPDSTALTLRSGIVSSRTRSVSGAFPLENGCHAPGFG